MYAKELNSYPHPPSIADHFVFMQTRSVIFPLPSYLIFAIPPTTWSRPKICLSVYPKLHSLVSPTFQSSSYASSHAFLSIVATRKIRQVLSDPNVSKAPEPDGIPLKRVLQNYPLYHAFSFSPLTKVFPPLHGRKQLLFLSQKIETLLIPTAIDPSPSLFRFRKLIKPLSPTNSPNVKVC